MSGRRVKALRRELIDLIGRSPRKATYQGYSNGLVVQKTKDELRTYRKAYMKTKDAAK